MAKVKPLDRRSYGQYCGLARALDAVGDRWSLLIVRELLTGPQRYHELLAGLPGIATNLLATRLRTLESSGVVERRISTRANAIAYALTPWGAQLREPVEALMRWSAPLMVSGRGGDTFQAHWLANALQALLRPGTAAEPAVAGIEVDGTIVVVTDGPDGPSVTISEGRAPGCVLHASAEVVLAMAAGVLSVDQAIAMARLEGDSRDLFAIFGRSPLPHHLGPGPGHAGPGEPRPG